MQTHKPQDRRDVFAYLITRRISEPFYALFPDGSGGTWTRVEYEDMNVKYCYFLETATAIQFMLAASDMAYSIIPIFSAQPITERRKKYYETQGYTICGTIPRN